MFPEWTELAFGEPVRQGDVLTRIQPGDDPWRNMLVVLTADCDLARAKFGGAISCLPIFDCEQYLLQFRFGGPREATLKRLTAELVAATSAGRESAPSVSASRMRRWVAEAGIEEVLLALQLAERSAAVFRAIVPAVKELTDLVPKTLADAAFQVARAKVALGDKGGLEKHAKSVATALAKDLNDLPGDAQYINQLSPIHLGGYVVYLRRIIEVNESAVVTTLSRLPAEAVYQRVSRLRPPYVYALSQKFGSVFSSIGLPDPHDQARATVALALASKGMDS